jgi:23S rRNA (guanine745-N1)-methyltransferase
VAPLASRPGHALLRCPICRLDLTQAAGALACQNRHSFDIARDGYVNLLRGGRRLPAAGGDSADQLRHRAAFLATGHFDAVAAMIARHLRHASPSPPGGFWHVLDAGCGTGHHLDRIASQLRAPAIGLGLDIAKEAARQAARRWPSLAFAVCDLWADWPVHDAAADLVISVFAPKNFTEMSRVLRPGGWMALVYPGPNHMAELGDRFVLMRRHEHKAQDYVEATERSVGPSTIARIVRRAILDRASIRAAVLMGPNARHIAEATLDDGTEALAVTFDLAVLFARKPSVGRRN